MKLNKKDNILTIDLDELCADHDINYETSFKCEKCGKIKHLTIKLEGNNFDGKVGTLKEGKNE